MKALLVLIGWILIIIGVVGCSIILVNIDWENYKLHKEVSTSLMDEAIDNAMSSSDFDYSSIEDFENVFGTANYAEDLYNAVRNTVLFQVIFAISIFFSGLVMGVFALAFAKIISLLENQASLQIAPKVTETA